MADVIAVIPSYQNLIVRVKYFLICAFSLNSSNLVRDYDFVKIPPQGWASLQSAIQPQSWSHLGYRGACEGLLFNRKGFEFPALG